MSVRLRSLSNVATRSIAPGGRYSHLLLGPQADSFEARCLSQSPVITARYPILLLRNARRHPTHISALAILLHRRALSTETSVTSNSPGGVLPPGFNAKEAKKPLPIEKAGTLASKQTVLAEKPENVGQEVVPRKVPTTVNRVTAVEDSSLTAMAAEKAPETSPRDQASEPKKEEKKLTIMQKIKREVMHYWDGTKLLAAEVRISTKLALKMAAGYELSRREQRQVGLSMRASRRSRQ